MEPSTAGRVEYLVGLVVGESHGLAERDTCYFTAASAAASAAVGAALAAVAPPLPPLLLPPGLPSQSSPQLSFPSPLSIAAALWLIVLLQQRAVAMDTMVKLVREQEVYFR